MDFGLFSPVFWTTQPGLLLDTEALARHADALPPSPDQAQGPGAQDQWLKVRAIRAVAQRPEAKLLEYGSPPKRQKNKHLGIGHPKIGGG